MLEGSLSSNNMYGPSHITPFYIVILPIFVVVFFSKNDDFCISKWFLRLKH